MPRPRPMRFITLDGDCIVCVSHKLHPSGYLLKGWSVGGKLIMEGFHRFIYRAHFGDIPEDWEVDHLCHNRACCNPDHLKALPKISHREQPKWSTKWGKFKEAEKLWSTGQVTRKELADRFNIAYSTAVVWVQKWNKNAIQI